MQLTAKMFETTLQMKAESCQLYRVALIDGKEIADILTRLEKNL